MYHVIQLLRALSHRTMTSHWYSFEESLHHCLKNLTQTYLIVMILRIYRWLTHEECYAIQFFYNHNIFCNSFLFLSYISRIWIKRKLTLSIWHSCTSDTLLSLNPCTKSVGVHILL